MPGGSSACERSSLPKSKLIEGTNLHWLGLVASGYSWCAAATVFTAGATRVSGRAGGRRRESSGAARAHGW